MSEIVQYIIVRRDLEMTHGKMAAQVAHASLASVYPYMFDKYVVEWLNGPFAKIILRAKNRNHLEKLIGKLEEAGLVYKDIVDSCRTELEKETDMGTLTCVGIKPYPKEMLKGILKKYQLYV